MRVGVGCMCMCLGDNCQVCEFQRWNSDTRFLQQALHPVNSPLQPLNHCVPVSSPFAIKLFKLTLKLSSI